MQPKLMFFSENWLQDFILSAKFCKFDPKLADYEK